MKFAMCSHLVWILLCSRLFINHVKARPCSLGEEICAQKDKNLSNLVLVNPFNRDKFLTMQIANLPAESILPERQQVSANQTVWNFHFDTDSSIPGQTSRRTKIEEHERIRVVKSRPFDHSTVPSKATHEYVLSWPMSKMALDDKWSLCFSTEDQQDTFWYPTFIAKNRLNYPMTGALPGSSLIQNNYGVPALLPESNNLLGTIVEHLFLSSLGFAVFLDPLHPWLYRQLSGQRFCLLLAKPDLSTHEYPAEEIDFSEHYLTMKLRILVAEDLTKVHKAAVVKYQYIERPAQSSLPTEMDLVTSPTLVLPKMFHSELVDPGMQILARDQFQEFLRLFTDQDIQKPRVLFHALNPNGNPTSLDEREGYQLAIEMIRNLSNFQLALEIIPFSWPMSVEDRVESHLSSNEFLLEFTQSVDLLRGVLAKISQHNSIEGIVSYWFPYANLLQKVGPNLKYAYNDLLDKYPNFLVTSYATAITELEFNQNSVIEAGFKSQGLPGTFVRLAIDVSLLSKEQPEQDPVKVLIGNGLTLSLAGYQLIVPEFTNFVLNDAFGMNVQWRLVRLVQALTFMPTVVVPEISENFAAQLNATVLEAIKNCFVLRRRRLLPIIDQLWKNWIETGEPIIRPMWYGNPEPVFQGMTSQFMLGPNILVAPYLIKPEPDDLGPFHPEQEIQPRKLYVPKGSTWKLYKDTVQTSEVIGHATSTTSEDVQLGEVRHFSKGWTPYLERQLNG